MRRLTLYPRGCSVVGVISRCILRLVGWGIVGALPDEKKYILIVAPHTSNWDLVIGLLGRFALGVRISFLGKKQMFFFPLGCFLRAVGGVPVDRSKPGHLVEQIVHLYRQEPALILGLTPEGTRSPVSRWKEGFYHIASQADIPIVLVGFDYKTKEIRIGPTSRPSGDIRKDFESIVAFFRTIKGKYAKSLPDYRLKP